MNPVMYLFINKGLGMSPGKIAAQAGHAAVEAYRKTPEDSNALRMWYAGGHYTKIVLEARDALHLQSINHYIQDRGFNTALIVDEGRTEIDPHTPTALGVEVVDKDNVHVAQTFSSFSLYKEDGDQPTKRRSLLCPFWTGRKKNTSAPSRE